MTGGFLAGSLLVAGLLFTDDPALTVALAGAVGYPLVAYAVVVAPDPTDVLPPRAVAAVGALLGLAATAVVAVTAAAPPADRAFLGLLAGLAFALPAVAYRVRYGPPGGPSPRRTVAAAAGVGAACLVAGPLVGAPLPAAAVGGVVALAGGRYALARGYRPAHRERRRGLLAGVAVALALLGVGLSAAVPLDGVLPGAAVAALGPAVYHALASESVA